MLRIDTENCEYDDKLLGRVQSKQATLQGCEKHYATSQLGRPLPNSQLCECCGKCYQKEQLQLGVDLQKLGYLGCGLPLYLSFIKLCIGMALLSSLLVAFPNLYLNYAGRSCGDPSNVLHCQDTLFLRLSVANKTGQVGMLELQSYLIAGNVVVMFVVIQFARRWMRQLQIVSELTPSPADYAVILKLPHSDYREVDVREAIEKWYQRELASGEVADSPWLYKCKKSFPVEKVVVSYDLKTFRLMEKELEMLTLEVKSLVPSPGGSNIARRTERINNIKNVISNKSFPRNSNCLVIFRYPEQQKYLLARYEKSFLEKLFCCESDGVFYDDYEVDITRAPMPSEILWQNHSLKTRPKQLARWLTKLGCFIAVVLLGAIIFGLLYLYFKLDKTTSHMDKFISPLIALTISICNICMLKLFSHLSNSELRSTLTEQVASSAWRLTVVMFLNSGMLLFVGYAIFGLDSLWIYSGFVDTLSYSFIFSVVLPQLYKYCSLDIIGGWYPRSKLRSSGIPQKITQQKANELFQRPSCHFDELYSQLVYQLWWCSFFAPLAPLGCPCIMLSLFFHYWIDKYNLLRIYAEPKPFGNGLNLQMLALLEFSLLLMATGNIILDFLLALAMGTLPGLSVMVVDGVAIFFGLAVYLLPQLWLDKIPRLLHCCSKEKMFLNIEYNLALANFSTTYEQENPLYRYDVMDKQKVIEENLQVEMEQMAQDLHDTLKKVHIDQHHPFRVSKGKQPEQTVMYASITYPEKIQRPTRKNSTLNIPSLRQYFDPVPRPIKFPDRPTTDRLVDFTQVVHGMDKNQKGQLLTRLLSSLKQINRKP